MDRNKRNKYMGNSSMYGLGQFLNSTQDGFDDNFLGNQGYLTYANNSLSSGGVPNTSNQSPVQTVSNNEIGNNAGVQAVQNLTNNNNADIDAAYASNPYSVDVVAQHRPQTNTLDIRRDQPSIELPELKDPNQSLGKVNQEEYMVAYERTRDEAHKQYLADQKKRDITGGAGSNYTAGVHKASGPPEQYPTNMQQATDMDAYGLNPPQEPPKIPGMLSDKDLYRIMGEEVNLDDMNIVDVTDTVEGDYKAPVSTDPLKRLKDLWAEEQTAKLAEGSKLGESLSQGWGKAKELGGKASDFMGKHAGTISAISSVASGVSEWNARKDIIGDLRDGVGKLEGVVAGMANKEAAEEEAMLDEFTEQNRRIGARQNLALGESLSRVKGSNISSGSVERIKDDITRKFTTSTDLNLADAADAYDKKVLEYTESSRDERAKTTEQLKQLRDQLKEQERQQKLAPIKLMADVAIGIAGASNPLLGMGLSAIKNKTMA